MFTNVDQFSQAAGALNIFLQFEEYDVLHRTEGERFHAVSPVPSRMVDELADLVATSRVTNES